MRGVCCSACFTLLMVAGCNDAQARLVPRDRIVNDAIPAPLTSTPGDAEAGANVFASRGGGHCVLRARSGCGLLTMNSSGQVS